MHRPRLLSRLLPNPRVLTKRATMRACETDRPAGNPLSRTSNLLARRITGKKGLMSADDKPGQKQTPEEETKRRFREALAAKQGRKGEDHVDEHTDRGQQHVHNHGPVET